jgi:hypothetical protein
LKFPPQAHWKGFPLLFLELLMVLFAQLTMTLGRTGAKFVMLFGFIFIALGLILFINWAFEYLFDIRIAQGTILRRRQQYADAITNKAAKRKIELYGELPRKATKLDVAGLERWCAGSPQDWAALYKLSELYEAAGDLKNFVRCREKVLKEMPRKGTGAEMATEWHRVADVYLELKDMEGARLGLEYFANQFSQTPEAGLARQRIARMTGNAPAPPVITGVNTNPFIQPEDHLAAPRSRKRLPPEI